MMSAIKKRRLELLMSQADLAQKVGVRQNTISGWELGTRHPSIAKLKILARVLECSINDLLKDEQEARDE